MRENKHSGTGGLHTTSALVLPLDTSCTGGYLDRSGILSICFSFEGISAPHVNASMLEKYNGQLNAHTQAEVLPSTPAQLCSNVHVQAGLCATTAGMLDAHATICVYRCCIQDNMSIETS